MSNTPPKLAELMLLFRDSSRPLSAAEIATKTGTYPATALRRVQALIKLGYPLKKTKVREGSRGFESTAWVLK